MRNFAVIGVGGYIAPRHLKAIKDTGNKVVATMDKNDSVGIIDKYFPNASFFTEFERFDRHCEKLRRENAGKEVDFVTVCTPNYLHDAHIRFGLRIGADVICEKPIVLNPWNLKALQELEEETGKKVYTVLQLRYHPSIVALKEKIDSQAKDGKHDITLTYMTPRGKWYFHSWKADEEKSGGVATNIGVHFFDMLMWIFGKPVKNEVHYRHPKKMVGYLELEKARVKWFLSLDREDLPKENLEGNKPYRSITIDGKEMEFSTGFTDLHTKVYEETLKGNGFGLEDALPSIQVVHDIREAAVEEASDGKGHPRLEKLE
ncbi:MAG: Gfo/Idh/MocA family oxidoreductase [Candidatus Woesearchaeota archaeon]